MAAFGSLATDRCKALDLVGFVEPYRTLRLSAEETGIIEEVLVNEGDAIEAGQPLVRLNCDVQHAMLAIAEQKMKAVGKLDAARAELLLRRNRLRKLEQLRSDGHARHEEVDRAAAEVAVADARVREANEELLTRKLDYAKIKTQIDRRTVRSPIAGVVQARHKDLGEFVAPNSPEILTLVELDRLLANFTVMSPYAARLRVNQAVKVHFPESARHTEGIIDFISPVTDAESGTVLIKVRINNADGRFRSGERCRIRLAG